MTLSLALLVFLGGVLTILSPCILPLLLGMALTFAPGAFAPLRRRRLRAVRADDPGAADRGRLPRSASCRQHESACRGTAGSGGGGVSALARDLCGLRACDLHLVLGSAADGHPVRFRVLLDGAPPVADHGADTHSDGYGVVREQRLYQLVRQSGSERERTFTIEFLDDGVQAYAFTFG